MKLGLLGGTFNPVHNGHLAAALGAAEALKLDEVWLVAAALPPQKDFAALLPSELRLELLRLALKPHTNLKVSLLEFERSEPSYTVVTLKQVAAQQHLNPKDLHFILGADALAGITTWWHWQELPKLANFVVINRAGYDWNTIIPIAEKMGFCYNGFQTIHNSIGATKETNIKEFQYVRKEKITGSEEKPGNIQQNPPQYPLFGGLSQRGHSSSQPENPDIRKNNDSRGACMKFTARNTHGLALYGVEIPAVNVSSSEIRERLRVGTSLAGLVPDAVNQHLMEVLKRNDHK